MVISDNTIAAVARLCNEALVELADAEVVQLVSEGRASPWKPGDTVGDLNEVLEGAIFYGLDAEQGAPHSGVDMQIVVADVIKYLAHRGYAIVPAARFLTVDELGTWRRDWLTDTDKTEV